MGVQRFPVESTHIMMFARAVRDPNPIYADANYAANTEVGGVIAPPTFVQASAHFDLDYPLRPPVNGPWWGSGRDATGVADRAATGGLHAEQHYEYHRPLLAGDVLTATVHDGKTWQKEGRRGGTLNFAEQITEYRALDGELVVTARGVSVMTGKVVEQEG